MIKFFIAACTFIFFISASYATELCPSIADIKNNQLHGWRAYYNDSGESVSNGALHKFEQTVGIFAGARWLRYAQEGASHCYYNDNNNQETIAYLAIHGLKPDLLSTGWKDLSYEFACNDVITNCGFVRR